MHATSIFTVREKTYSMRYFVQILVAAAGVLAATGIRWAIDDMMPPGFPFLTYFPVVVLSAYFAGLLAGIVSAALATVAAYVFFMAGQSGENLSAPLTALGFFILVTVVDILIIYLMRSAQHRLRIEQQRSAALAAENANLVVEAQHRISNNLQMLSSLLSLQRSSVTDLNARRALQEASNRVNVISRIQRNLYSCAGGWDPQRLRDLVADTIAASHLPHVRVDQTIAVHELPAETVVPLGLIVLELVSNALEHSGGRPDLEIRVELMPDNDRTRLMVADNGTGFPPGFDPAKARSLGMRIVAALVGQLRGELQLENQNGATAIVLF